MWFRVTLDVKVDPSLAPPDQWDWECMLGVTESEDVRLIDCARLTMVDKSDGGRTVSGGTALDSDGPQSQL